MAKKSSGKKGAASGKVKKKEVTYTKHPIYKKFKKELPDFYSKLEIDKQVLRTHASIPKGKQLKDFFYEELIRNTTAPASKTILLTNARNICNGYLKNKGELHSLIKPNTLLGRVNEFTALCSKIESNGLSMGLHVPKTFRDSFKRLAGGKKQKLKLPLLKMLKKTYGAIAMGTYYNWSFLDPSQTGPFTVRKNIDLLPCQLALPQYVEFKIAGKKVDWVLYGFLSSAAVDYTVPTVFDADFDTMGNTLFMPGGKTDPLAECKHLPPLVEVYHKPETFSDIYNHSFADITMI